MTTHYLYDLAGNLIAEHGGDGAWQRIYVRLDGMLVGGARRGGPRIGAIHVDHLGTPQKVTDETAAVVWDAVYRPFGATESIAGPLTFNLRFPGQYFDDETGLHYNYFRDYDPLSGRYLESDPIGLQGGWNTYAYALNNPGFWVDPRGGIAQPPGPPEGTALCILLRGLVHVICDVPRSCAIFLKNPPTNDTACQIVANYIGKNKSCIWIRETVMTVCYGGGDQRHKDHVDRVKDDLKKCEDIFRRYCMNFCPAR